MRRGAVSHLSNLTLAKLHELLLLNTVQVEKMLVDCSQPWKTVGQGNLQNVPFLSNGKINILPFYSCVLVFISVVLVSDWPNIIRTLVHRFRCNQNHDFNDSKISLSHRIKGSGSCVVSSHHLMTVLNLHQYSKLMNYDPCCYTKFDRIVATLTRIFFSAFLISFLLSVFFLH
jgi:hypothetical protein